MSVVLGSTAQVLPQAVGTVEVVLAFGGLIAAATTIGLGLRWAGAVRGRLERGLLLVVGMFMLTAVIGLSLFDAAGPRDAWFEFITGVLVFAAIAAVAAIIAGATGALARRRRTMDRMFKLFAALVTCLSLVALMVLLGSVMYLGWEYLSWDLLSNYASRVPEKAGIRAALAGTIWICVICAVVAIPVGVATAVYLEEYAKPTRLTRIIDLNISNLAGVPSIVYGIIGLTVFARAFGMMGPINNPNIQLGATHYDEYVSAAGDPVRLPLSHRHDPVRALQSGDVVQSTDGRSFSIEVVPNGQGDGAEQVWASDAAEPYQRSLKRSWYYFQVPFGGGVLAGGLVLALVVLPIVIVSTREALRGVPDTLREGALACGATKWQCTRLITLPAALPGIMTGSILAFSRAMGEAAPLLVLTGILFIRFTPENLMDDFTALPLQIYNWAGRPQAEFHAVASSSIIVLLVVLLSFNAIAILIREWFQRPLQ
jgi:phosphate transport system permease protein